MRIETVTVEDVSFSAEEGRFRATLLIEGSGARMCFRAKAATAPAAQRHEVVRLLVADALRQLGRMPEYRNTAHPITLTPGAWPV